MNTLVEGDLESIDQVIGFTRGLSEQNYQYLARPYIGSSIGQHLRHALDMYKALRKALETSVVDYNLRRRGDPVEVDRNLALAELGETQGWLLNITPIIQGQAVIVKTETTLSHRKIESYQSSFGRELGFVTSHLIHHFAIMVSIARIAGEQVDPEMGLAPATVNYVRSLAVQN